MAEYPIALFTKKFLSALKKFRSITDFLEKAQKMSINWIDSYLARIERVKQSAILAVTSATYDGGNGTLSSFDIVKNVLEDSSLIFEVES